MLSWCDYAQPSDGSRTVAEAAGSLIALHQQHSLIDVPQGQAHSVQFTQCSISESLFRTSDCQAASLKFKESVLRVALLLWLEPDCPLAGTHPREAQMTCPS
jgi:hypothetical protein